MNVIHQKILSDYYAVKNDNKILLSTMRSKFNGTFPQPVKEEPCSTGVSGGFTRWYRWDDIESFVKASGCEIVPRVSEERKRQDEKDKADALELLSYERDRNRKLEEENSALKSSINEMMGSFWENIILEGIVSLRLKRQKIPPYICGIYFLFNGDELVYVGQSVDVISRVRTHACEGYKAFDSFAFIEVEKDRLDATEKAYIGKYLPEHNVCSFSMAERRVRRRI